MESFHAEKTEDGRSEGKELEVAQDSKFSGEQIAETEARMGGVEIDTNSVNGGTNNFIE
jgi:hypothetical protein